MILSTPVEMPADLPKVSQADNLMLLGSCFADHIGKGLQEAKFHCTVNPYGTLYNPLSISAALREIGEGRRYTAADLYCSHGCWHSSMHHGDFSSPDREETLRRIRRSLSEARERLSRTDCLLLTWGTAWVYEEKATGRIVGNFHKQPDSLFTRRMLTVEEIVEDYKACLNHSDYSNCKIILSVSPIRHVRDGMHANQLSKAVLLLAADRLQAAFPGRVFYFPAYELLMDELRDYRFYAADMVHPSDTAVQYVWERFVQACFTPEAVQIADVCESIRKALSHKPFHPESEEYKYFLGQIVLKIDRLNGKYPYLDFQNERDLCRIRLKA